MIQLQDLCKSYNGKPVVKNVSLEIGKGETMVLLGKSGSGKSTILKMINGLVTPNSGAIYIDRKDANEIPVEELRRGIGYVIQHIGLFPHYTIEENISVVPHLMNWSSAKISERVGELTNLLSLDADILPRYPSELSGGQQQRVGVARALAANPAVVLLDEPFGALDPITRNEIQEEFRSLESLLNKTMVLVTHDVSEAVSLADRIALIDEGEVQQVGTPKEILLAPANDFVRQFFDADRTHLEQKALCLADILPAMKFSQESGREISTTVSLATILREYDQDQKLLVKGNDGSGSFTVDQVLPAYYSYKARQKS